MFVCYLRVLRREVSKMLFFFSIKFEAGKQKDELEQIQLLCSQRFVFTIFRCYNSHHFLTILQSVNRDEYPTFASTLREKLETLTSDVGVSATVTEKVRRVIDNLQ